MIVLSVRANTRFRKEQKLPMQWMISRSQPLSSTVIRSAPRVLALGFVPFLGITVLSLFAIGATTLTQRERQRIVKGKTGTGRVEPGGGRILEKKNNKRV